MRTVCVLVLLLCCASRVHAVDFTIPPLTITKEEAAVLGDLKQMGVYYRAQIQRQIARRMEEARMARQEAVRAAYPHLPPDVKADIEAKWRQIDKVIEEHTPVVDALPPLK